MGEGGRGKAAKDAAFGTNSEGTDLDPVTEVFVRRCTAVRRISAIAPKVMKDIDTIIEEYSKMNHPGVRTKTEGREDKEPAPMPGEAERAKPSKKKGLLFLF